MAFFSRLKAWLKRFLENLLNFLFPKSERVIVLEALSAGELLTKLPPAQGPDEENVFALFDYSHPLVKEIVWEVKYGGNSLLAARLGEIMFDVIESELSEKGILFSEARPLLIPMPVSGKRRFERGWNQAELLAEGIKQSDKGGKFKYVPGQLVKIVHTESQTKTASKKERRENLHQTMKVLNPEAVSSRFIILVDDVVTTGSTFAEARRALREAGARKILCFAAAH